MVVQGMLTFLEGSGRALSSLIGGRFCGAGTTRVNDAISTEEVYTLNRIILLSLTMTRDFADFPYCFQFQMLQTNIL